MNRLKNIFRKTTSVKTTEDFWMWFLRKERLFAKSVQDKIGIEEYFFDVLTPVLNQLNCEVLYLLNEEEEGIELIFTADDILKNTSFIQDLVVSAPHIEGWRFTAFISAVDIESAALEIDGYTFSKDTICFYSTATRKCCENSYTIVYSQFDKSNLNIIRRGVFSFLEAYLGELIFINEVDSIKIVGWEDLECHPFAIENIKEAVHWKSAELADHYADTKYCATNDFYIGFLTEAHNENAILLKINKTALEWEDKRAYPWIFEIKITFDAKNSHDIYKKLDALEYSIMNSLTDKHGYVNVAAHTGNCYKIFYFACKYYGIGTSVLNDICSQDESVYYRIFKDRNWTCFQSLQEQKANINDISWS